MSKINRVRSVLYKSGRILGDANAIVKKKIPQRIARRIAGKGIGRLLGKVFK